MLQHKMQHFWSRSLLIFLVCLTAIGTTTFVALQEWGAHAASRGTNAAPKGPNSSFKITADGDTYTFVNKTPGSLTGKTLNFGSWAVSGPAGSGTLSGDIVAAADAKGHVSEDGTIQSPFVSGTDAMTEYPTLPATPAGLTRSANTEGPLGAEVVQECTPPSGHNIACGNHFVQGADGPIPAEEFERLDGSPEMQLLQQAVALQTKAVGGLAASPAPASPALARNHGGGPLAASQAQVPAFALAVFLIGVGILVAGIAAQSACQFTTCSPKVKGALAVIGAVLMVVGSILTGGAGVVFYTAARAASAASLVASTEMITTAVAEGAAMTAARLTAIEESLSLLTSAVITGAGA